MVKGLLFHVGWTEGIDDMGIIRRNLKKNEEWTVLIEECFRGREEYIQRSTAAGPSCVLGTGLT